MNTDDYIEDPRGYAISLVEEQLVDASYLLTAALKFMPHDEVRTMLDINELSPRFMGEDE